MADLTHMGMPAATRDSVTPTAPFAHAFLFAPGHAALRHGRAGRLDNIHTRIDSHSSIIRTGVHKGAVTQLLLLSRGQALNRRAGRAPFWGLTFGHSCRAA